VRFSLQDVKRSVQRRGGELSVTLYFLRPGELHVEIEELIEYYEHLLGKKQRQFSLDTARACIGEDRLANCLVATLSNWYNWRQRAWDEVLYELTGEPDSPTLSPLSPSLLRLALFDYVNEHYHGFLSAQVRPEVLSTFARTYGLQATDFEYLLALDSEDEMLLTRDVAQPPTADEVAVLYNQWVFEAALFNASNVHFVLNSLAVNAMQALDSSLQPLVGTGLGAFIKRLCYLSRKLGVYYDLSYERSLLHLDLYGPQEVTGAPQQYGMRLARLCRLLLGYGSTGKGKRRQHSLSEVLVGAEATVHLLQNPYKFTMDAHLLQLLPSLSETEKEQPGTSSLFDSSIEQRFAEAFEALAHRQGVDGWRLEREPEPLLLEAGVFIPDFAFTRGAKRIYVEILGFWTPSYRERKVQRLQQLQGRTDLLLAIPVEAKDAFESVLSHFPTVIYNGQLSVTDVLQILRTHYDDFSERLALIDISRVRERVRREGLLPEQTCYEVLHCYRRSELPQAASHVINAEIQFLPGTGLYHLAWMDALKQAFITWLRGIASISLREVLHEMRARWHDLALCNDATLEAMISSWSEVHIRRDSIFDAIVEIGDTGEEAVKRSEQATGESSIVTPGVEKVSRKSPHERKASAKKRANSEVQTVQEDLWG
jgi:predicted nuclease of restriction endonuclease-like RecB superfamily